MHIPIKYWKFTTDMRRILILAICILPLIIGIVSATEYQGHKQNQQLQFSITSNNATGCNVSTLDTPDGTKILNIPMTKSIHTFYTTISSANFTGLGDYCFNIECTDGTSIETGSVCRNVTPTGSLNSTGQAIIYFIILIVSMGIFVFLFYASIKLPFKNERNQYDEIVRINWKKYLKMFCITMAYIVLVWIVYISWNIAYGYLDMRSAGGIFNVIFTILIALFLPLLLGMGIFLLVAYLSDKKINEYIKRGVPIT